MSAASRFTSLSVIVVGVAGWAAPAAARPFLKFKIKHFIPTMSVDLGKGRALDVSALGPVHVSGDRGFVGGVVNTTSDLTQPAATLLQRPLQELIISCRVPTRSTKRSVTALRAVKTPSMR
uniref:hypothetical protein n=1 Tax=Methylobacterium radiotolerans TaxID=31998 RepID=UPI00273A3A4B|nr:hypothetical protein [Methylobacterium radiotolerans]WKV18885.1 hypothetical protein [Methylobacterium radiotolerans JCM 2831]